MIFISDNNTLQCYLNGRADFRFLLQRLSNKYVDEFPLKSQVRRMGFPVPSTYTSIKTVRLEIGTIGGKFWLSAVSDINLM